MKNMKEYKYKDYSFKIMRAKDLPLWHLDLSEMHKMYPTFENWLKYSICDKQAIACFYNYELVGYLIYSKKTDFKYIKMINEKINNSNIYKMCSIFVDGLHRDCGIGSYMIHLMKKIENPNYIYITCRDLNTSTFLQKNKFYQISGVKHKFTGDSICLLKV